MTEEGMVLRGLQPQPLGSYLAALGLLRVCSKQHGSRVRGAFGAGGFVLQGIGATDLCDLLLDRYSPSPILTPWNNASGFFESPKGRLAAAAMKRIAASKQARFSALLQTIDQVRALVIQRGYVEAPEAEEKAGFIASLRSVLSDDAVAWLDAVAIVADSEARMMPMLGSGGNEGVLDYSGLFLRSLVDTLLADRTTSARLLKGALFSESSADLLERAGGQFDPGTAGGFNTGPGFESKDLPNNPWTFVLLVEGTLVWASAIASRQQGMDAPYRFAVSPFTVRHRAAGHGSASRKDADPKHVRAEVWVPVWRRPAAMPEISRFIAEGRVDVRSRRGATKRAADSLDFADAVASLGVDRGVDSFVRYAIVKRRGESFLALPAGVVAVHHRCDVDLVRQLDAELRTLDGFVDRFPGEGPPAHILSHRRAIDDARFDVAQRGGPDAMRRLVRAIGAMEMTLARRDPGKEPKLRRPLGGLEPEWIDACGDDVEVRLASAIAAIARTGGAGSMRSYLAPLDVDDDRQYAPAPRPVAWSGFDLADRLASVLRRRLLDVRRRSGDPVTAGRNPTWGARRATLSDVALFLSEGLVDERLLEELVFGFTWVKPAAGGSALTTGLAPPLPRAYALLKLLFLPDGIPKGNERVLVAPDITIVALLRAGRVADAIDVGRRQLIAKGFRPRHVIDGDVRNAVLGRRLAAALLIPVVGTSTLAADALMPNFDTHSETTTDQPDKQEPDHAR